MSSSSSVFWLTAVAICIYAIYRRLLPRPILGIPYHRASSTRILGDIPLVSKHMKETGGQMSWFPSQAKKLNSPIFQVFYPLSTPWVVITDFRESQDILTKRTKEFDRGPHFIDIFRGLIPDHHITMKSTDPQFKVHRKLIQDVMTPAFLTDVCHLEPPALIDIPLMRTGLGPTNL